MMNMKTIWQKLFPRTDPLQTSVKGVIAPSCDPDEMLISRLTEHEGIKKFGYLDSKGYMTVGIGRCIQSGVGKGLSIDEIFFLLRNDITDFRSQLKKYDWFTIQDEVRANALVELAFNLGIEHLLKFENMIDALRRKSYPEAAKELLNSEWAMQVGAIRSSDLAYRLAQGRYK